MKYVISCCLLVLSVFCRAQTPFRSLPKIHVPENRFFRTITTQHDSLLSAWRFSANIAAYAEPGNILMAGVGYGYQHLKYDYSSSKWVCQWSINAVGFAGGSVAPTTPSTIVSFGILGGIVNNLIMAGPIYNPGAKQFGIALSLGISLNN